MAGEILKVIAPEFYKKDQQSQRLNWFNRLAKEEGKSLHIAAGWSYLTDDQIKKHNVVTTTLTRYFDAEEYAKNGYQEAISLNTRYTELRP